MLSEQLGINRKFTEGNDKPRRLGNFLVSAIEN
jgi:hypothetical protein